MKIQLKHIATLLLTLQLTSTPFYTPWPIRQIKSSSTQKEYTSWAQACNKLPAFTHIGSSHAYTALDWQMFNETLQEFMQVNKQWYQEKYVCWIHNAPAADSEFYNTHAEIYQPFVQKIVVNPNSTIALRGDLHGDIHSLLSYIKFMQEHDYMDGFTITKKDFYLLFLGDYVDRGNYGAEVLYTLMRLKITNPNNVIMVRGNHEDIEVCQRYGFSEECAAKFGTHNFLSITRLYDFLPVALYLGSGSQGHTDYLQCCHGGMEVGYNPNTLLQKETPIAFDWITKLPKKSDFLTLNCCDNTTKEDLAHVCKLQDISHEALLIQKNYGDIGFMWSDFHVPDDGTIIKPSPRGAGLIYGKDATHAILQRANSATHTVRGVLRAHQHTDVMDAMMENILDPYNITNHKGVGKLWKNASSTYNDLWNGIVCTFLVAPDTNYSCKGSLFDFDAYALLTVAPTFDAWRMKVHRTILSDIISVA